MRVFVDVSHPAHVHLYGRLIQSLSSEGHPCMVTARDKDVTLELLRSKGIPHQAIGGRARRGRKLWGEWLARDRAVFAAARRFRPNLLLGNLNPAIAHASALLRKPSINFLDHEPHIMRFPVGNWVTIPFTDTLVVPNAVRHDYGRKAVVVPSYKELAYLHPNHWTPDPQVQAWLHERTRGPFALIRFVSWTAHHDVGKAGLSPADKADLVHEISKQVPVWISSEGPLSPDLEKFRLPLPAPAIHTALHEASLFVGDSQTMATEAAVLGTPVVRVNQFVGLKDMGNFIELEEKYGLLRNRRTAAEAKVEVRNLLGDPDAKAKAQAARRRLLSDKMDLAAFLKWFVLGYPETVTVAQSDPEVFQRFMACRS